MKTATLTILGVDPGSAATGWAAISAIGNRVTLEGSGVIRPKGKERSARLADLALLFTAVVEQYQLAEAAVETPFTGRNPKSTIALAEARGALLAVLGGHKITVQGYTPAAIKRSVVGTGRAEKEQVVFMVTRLLGLTKAPTHDAADAMAVALTHIHMRRWPKP